MAARLATILVAAIVGTTLIAGLIVGAQRADDSGPVDLIIHNAKVYLADDLGSMADAIAVRGNKILKVGSEREIMRLKKPQTTVVDAKGAAVLPGFDDAHASLVDAGLATEGVQLFGAGTLDEIGARIEAYAAAHLDQAWIVGHGWSYDVVGDPTRTQLDAIFAGRPVKLVSHDGRTAWVNTRALSAAGITKRTAATGNGAIVKDRRGDPTGILKGEAMGERFPDDPLLKTGLVTISLDGSVESLGAALLAPYSGKGAEEGRLSTSPAELSRLVATLDARGWQVAVEASGDRAVRAALDALGAAGKAPNGGKSRRHRVEGLSVIDADDI